MNVHKNQEKIYCNASLNQATKNFPIQPIVARNANRQGFVQHHIRQFLNMPTVFLIRGFETFIAVKIQMRVFRVVTPCSVVVGHQRFTAPFSILRNLQ